MEPETPQETFKSLLGRPAERDPPNLRLEDSVAEIQTRDVLTITFPKPMDHALAQRVIQSSAIQANGCRGKSRWKTKSVVGLSPHTQPWRRGPYES